MIAFTKEFQIVGIELLQEKLKLLKNIVEAKRTVGLNQAGHLMAGYCKVNCPVDTGRLRASIGSPSGGGVFNSYPTFIVFGTAVYYALWVEDGTQPHIIKPKNGKFLAWPSGPVASKIKFTETGISRGGSLYMGKSGKLTGSKKNQQYIFAKSVRHPGYKGSHFMLNGVTQSVGPVVDFLANFYTEAMAV